MKVETNDFGEGYSIISLTNVHGVKLSVSDLGARIVRLEVPFKETVRNLVLSFDSAKEYLEIDPYIGATIGRVAGRIKGGKFSIDEVEHQVQVNNNGNTLHGATPGFELKKWEYEIVEGSEESSVVFRTTSPDGENGFEGNLEVEVTYTLSNENVWTVSYHASTDKITLFNPTNHVYFNLTGSGANPIDQHQLQVNASRFLPTRESDNTVTGERVEVANTAFDFTTKKTLKDCFESDYPQQIQVSGMDHPFLLDEVNGEKVQAILELPSDQLKVEVKTEENSIVIFTASFGQDAAKYGGKVVHHGGITFETQAPPGAIEFDGLGDIVLRPEKNYTSKTQFKLTF